MPGAGTLILGEDFSFGSECYGATTVCAFLPARVVGSWPVVFTQNEQANSTTGNRIQDELLRIPAVSKYYTYAYIE